MRAETHRQQDTVVQVMLGLVVKVETAAVVPSLGLRVPDLRPGVAPSQRTCVAGETSFCGCCGDNTNNNVDRNKVA